jgi:2-C-methyl-D-erythritol 2,4-cyclodiphosphate synthase
MSVRVGFGYDVHKLVMGRKLILGGIEVPFERGLEGHSDADVLLHAITDALFGAAALGDIGSHFPDTDPAYKNADSGELLRKTIQILHSAGFEVNNIDATVAAQAPKLREFIGQMRARISSICGIAIGQVSVKATTTEKLGFVGRGEGLEAYAVCTLNTRS